MKNLKGQSFKLNQNLLNKQVIVKIQNIKKRQNEVL